jgi:uncharacterized protein (TIGR03435 family)
MATIKRRSAVFGMVGFTLMPAPTFASSQAISESKLTFDVATVKPSDVSVRQSLVIQPGGRFVANSFTLQALIAIAYRLTPFGMSPVQGWMADQRWDIEAKAETVTSVPTWVPPNIPEMMAARLRNLLEERFQLKVHRETRVQPVYVLTLAKGGSKLASVSDPTQERTSPTAEQPKQRPGSFRAGPGVVIGAAVSVDQILKYLDRLMDREVIDKTGLTGYFDITLKFAPESAPRFVPAQPSAGSPAEPPTSTDPSIFTTLQEQLGLKLQATREPMPFLVIESARKPAEN